jgi:26S proteasome regulatory subunit N9
MSQGQVRELLSQLHNSVPTDLQQYVSALEEFWGKRLWHQLTEALSEFYDHKDSKPFRIEVYRKFILSFSTKINQLKLVSLGLSAAAQYEGMNYEPDSALGIYIY